MIRKHTRRAAKAAFAIAMGVAIVLGGTAAATAAPAKSQATPIIIGTKNFTEQYLLGELYQQALAAKGFSVSQKPSIGSTELISKALTSGKITLYPEYIGVILSVTFGKKTTPSTASATYALAKKLYEAKGYTLLKRTPFQDVDVIAVSKATASKYGLKSIADLKKVPDLTLAGFPEFETRRIPQLASVYGVSDVKFVPIASLDAYQLLDKGTVLAADVFTTDAKLASGKYVLLKDPKNIFGFQYVAPIVSEKLVSEYGQKFVAAVNAVSSKLTTPAMIAMNKAVAGDKKTPKAVAAAFLKANGLS